MKMKCTNAAHPDSYGHYREAIVTAIKHHWWWKVRQMGRKSKSVRKGGRHVAMHVMSHQGNRPTNCVMLCAGEHGF